MLADTIPRLRMPQLPEASLNNTAEGLHNEVQHQLQRAYGGPPAGVSGAVGHGSGAAMSRDANYRASNTVKQSETQYAVQEAVTRGMYSQMSKLAQSSKRTSDNIVDLTSDLSNVVKLTKLNRRAVREKKQTDPAHRPQNSSSSNNSSNSSRRPPPAGPLTPQGSDSAETESTHGPLSSSRRPPAGPLTSQSGDWATTYNTENKQTYDADGMWTADTMQPSGIHYSARGTAGRYQYDLQEANQNNAPNLSQQQTVGLDDVSKFSKYDNGVVNDGVHYRQKQAIHQPQFNYYNRQPVEVQAGRGSGALASQEADASSAAQASSWMPSTVQLPNKEYMKQICNTQQKNNRGTIKDGVYHQQMKSHHQPQNSSRRPPAELLTSQGDDWAAAQAADNSKTCGAEEIWTADTMQPMNRDNAAQQEVSRYKLELQQPPQQRNMGQGFEKLANKIGVLLDRVNTPPMHQTSQHESTKRRSPKIQPPTFDGGSESGFNMWQSSLEDYFNYLNWQIDDPQRLLILPTLLTNSARMHYTSIPQHEKTTYQGAMKAMAQAFSIRSQPPIIRAARLQRKQGLTESVREYSLEIIKRMLECDITDADRQLDIYMQNLREDVAKKVLLMSPTSLRHAQLCAETVEHTMNWPCDKNINAVAQQQSRIDKFNQNEGQQRSQKNNRKDRHRSDDRNRSISPDRKKIQRSPTHYHRNVNALESDFSSDIPKN